MYGASCFEWQVEWLEPYADPDKVRGMVVLPIKDGSKAGPELSFVPYQWAQSGKTPGSYSAHQGSGRRRLSWSFIHSFSLLWFLFFGSYFFPNIFQMLIWLWCFPGFSLVWSLGIVFYLSIPLSFLCVLVFSDNHLCSVPSSLSYYILGITIYSCLGNQL